MIRYYLQPNYISTDPNDQVARIVANNVFDTEAIIKLMLLRGTTLTETDIRAVVYLLCDVTCRAVADGNNVNLPIGNIRPGIIGIFNSATDSFDGSRHTKKATLSAGALLWEYMEKATVEKVLQPPASPALLEYFDVNTQLANARLTPGGIGQLAGDELKFNPANAAEGIFIINSTGTATQASIIASRTEGKLVFSVPTGLAAGNYTLEVRRGYGNAASIRTGTLNEVLQVV